jgi:hypothetical protein
MPRSAPSPRPLLFFFFLITDGGSAAEAKDLTDARLMAAMPPRPVAFYFLRILIASDEWG